MYVLTEVRVLELAESVADPDPVVVVVNEVDVVVDVAPDFVDGRGDALRRAQFAENGLKNAVEYRSDRISGVRVNLALIAQAVDDDAAGGQGLFRLERGA